jgi:hypothetical protein
MSDFNRRLEWEIPRLRRYARALTRNMVLADDLVQETLMRAVHKQHLWELGTDRAKRCASCWVGRKGGRLEPQSTTWSPLSSPLNETSLEIS